MALQRCVWRCRCHSLLDIVPPLAQAHGDRPDEQEAGEEGREGGGGEEEGGGDEGQDGGGAGEGVSGGPQGGQRAHVRVSHHPIVAAVGLCRPQIPLSLKKSQQDSFYNLQVCVVSLLYIFISTHYSACVRQC